MKQFIPLCLVAAALSACNQSNERSSGPTSGGDVAGCSTRAYDNIGGPISLIDHTGTRVTEEDFKGQETLVYFGFTYCPDVCPISLTQVGAAIDLLPDGVQAPRTMLISVDPERDTPAAMAAYIESNGFPEDIVGLTGTLEEIEAAASEFKSSFRRIEMPDSAAGYTMDHMSILYLMDKDWRLKTFFATSATSPREMADCIAALSS